MAGFRSKTFQSPRSGKFVSDVIVLLLLVENILTTFQSPRSGKFVSDFFKGEHMNFIEETFQSPRSGKFVSDSPKNACKLTMSFKRTINRWHYITNGKMFENVAKKIFQIRTLLLTSSLR